MNNAYAENKRTKFLVIANWAQGQALSGGDRIFIELGKRWVDRMDITLYVSQESWETCKKHRLEDINHKVWASARFNKYGYLINYTYRTLISVIKSLRVRIDENDIIYSTSDFWPDSVPAFIMKLKNKNIRWVAGFYLFAPRPWRKDSPYKGKKWGIGLFYYLTQKPIYGMIKRYADIVFVTSKPDVEKFITKTRDRNKVILVRGGVDIEPSEEYLNSGKVIPIERRKYDACFVGRLHYQKGILELIDIWKLVCKARTEGKLVIIGIGPLEKEVRKKISALRSNRNIDLLGFKDGEEKYEIFKQSKIVVHPATYDSGGMAAAEAMAWALPGVSFDLEALKTYYPKGMLKTKCFDLQEFADNIIELLTNKELYKKLSKEALKLVKEEWDWNKRAEYIYDSIINGEK